MAGKRGTYLSRFGRVGHLHVSLHAEVSSAACQNYLELSYAGTSVNVMVLIDNTICILMIEQVMKNSVHSHGVLETAGSKSFAHSEKQIQRIFTLLRPHRFGQLAQ